MPSSPDSSPQTAAVLRSFMEDPQAWRYGYDLSKQTGLKSGTLYPILVRLAERGYLDRRWEQSPHGRAPRHMYRLTDAGIELATRPIEAPSPIRPVARVRWEGAS